MPADSDNEFKTMIEDLKSLAIDIIKKSDDIPDDAQFAIQNISNPIILLNFISTSMPFAIKEKMGLLKLSSLKNRAIGVLKILNRELQLLDIKHNIRTRTREDIDEQQREYFLQQQIKNIKEELNSMPNDRE